uniref:SUN domain-containing protein n=1 Tax=Caenorhabditis tropicalis TaxID=1561998 RepID=A0A1I7V3M8_9PELO
MPPVIEDEFSNHEWKSEFASTHSGRNSPNIFAKVRRRLLLTPPIRNVRSPRLTEEELDALTSSLPYKTNYTYAERLYYPDHTVSDWEVPNLAGGMTSELSEQQHFSAASLGKQLFYLIRFPIFFIIHLITYIFEAAWNIIRLLPVTIWDYILYFIGIARTRFATYQDNRRRKALIRNRQDPWSVKAGQFLRRFFATIFYIVSTPYRWFANRNAGVQQYQYKSIKDQLENERVSRITTRSQALERSRRFDGLSQSPSRQIVPAAVTTSHITRIATRVITSVGGSTSETPTVVQTRTVRERSVTPRFHATRSTTRQNRVDVDTPLSTRLRSRVSHTPEPSFDIGNAAATSTPLQARVLDRALYESNEKSIFTTVITWIGYIVLFPIFAARHIFYTVKDYGKSAYMKLTNYQPTAMEAIHVRDIDEPAPIDNYSSGILYQSWTTRLSNFSNSFFQSIKESHQIVFAVLYGGIQDAYAYVSSLLRGLTDKKSSRFSLFQVFGLILALLLAWLLFGFLTSDNTAIRVNKLQQDTNVSKSLENDHSTVPFYATVGKHIKHYTWMVKEFFYDIAFDTYNYIKPAVGRTVTAPRYAWDLIVSAFGATSDKFGSIRNTISEYGTNLWYFLTSGFSSTGNSITEYINDVHRNANKKITGFAENSKSFLYDAFNFTTKFISSIFIGFLKLGSDTFYYIGTFIKNSFYGLYDAFYNFVYAPIAKSFIYLTRNYQELLQPVWSFLRWVYNSVVYGMKTIIEWTCFLVSYPFALTTRAWVKMSEYAPEDVVQVIPIPQAVTPTPDIEKIVEQSVEPMDTLHKRNEIGDEELVIIPAPAPEPIPVPAPTPEPPVIIHQTNVVETVDKDAIINEVADKLRAELSAQFQQELSAKFEQSYNTIIQKLKVENSNIQYDNHHLEAMIRQLIYEYDTDKTGQVDYALESSGGAVISTRCSETYKSYTRLEKFWDIPIYYHHYSPRVVIQRNSKSLFPGECWCFKDGRGYIAVELSHFIDVSSISYEHIGKEVAPEGNRSSAPKGVLVWAYKQIDDLNSRVLIGDYTYNLDGPPLQFFIAKHKPDFPVKFVELEVTSNYGAEFTCLYRLRVHGKMLHL